MRSGTMACARIAKMKSHKPRSPGRKGRFCWHKKTDSAYTWWRLFLRHETTNQVRAHSYGCHVDTPRDAIAFALWKMRRRLRDTVDAVDLQNLGVNA